MIHGQEDLFWQGIELKRATEKELEGWESAHEAVQAMIDQGLDLVVDHTKLLSRRTGIPEKDLEIIIKGTDSALSCQYLPGLMQALECLYPAQWILHQLGYTAVTYEEQRDYEQLKRIVEHQQKVLRALGMNQEIPRSSHG